MEDRPLESESQAKTARQRGRRSGGYAAALLGTLAGTVLIGGGAAIVAVQVANRVGEGGGGTLYALLIVSLGVWLGAVAGCWLGLRIARYRAAAGTAALLTPLMLGALVVVWLPITGLAGSNIGPEGILTLLVCLIGAASLLARAAVSFLRR